MTSLEYDDDKSFHNAMEQAEAGWKAATVYLLQAWRSVRSFQDRVAGQLRNERSLRYADSDRRMTIDAALCEIQTSKLETFTPRADDRKDLREMIAFWSRIFPRADDAPVALPDMEGYQFKADAPPPTLPTLSLSDVKFSDASPAPINITSSTSTADSIEIDRHAFVSRMFTYLTAHQSGTVEAMYLEPNKLHKVSDIKWMLHLDQDPDFLDAYDTVRCAESVALIAAWHKVRDHPQQLVTLLRADTRLNRSLSARCRMDRAMLDLHRRDLGRKELQTRESKSARTAIWLFWLTVFPEVPDGEPTDVVIDITDA